MESKIKIKNAVGKLESVRRRSLWSTAEHQNLMLGLKKARQKLSYKKDKANKIISYYELINKRKDSSCYRRRFRIDFATTKILAGEGVNIVLTDITHEELEEAADEVRANIKVKNKIVAVSADLTKKEDAQILAAETRNNLAERISQ